MINIPKIIHFAWLGADADLPERCLASWQRLNPTYQVKLWDNEALSQIQWVNSQVMSQLISHDLDVVSLLMRYEILYHDGGLIVDPHAYCLRSLEDWLLEPEEFTCWENEIHAPGLISPKIIGAVQNSSYMFRVIKEISAMHLDDYADLKHAFGAGHLTKVWRDNQFPMTVYPSHYFVPKFRVDLEEYGGQGPVFAKSIDLDRI